MNTWDYSKKESSKGIVIVIHGLNNNPSIMNEQVAILNDLGYHTLTLTLTGHHQNKPETKHNSSKKSWVKDLETAIGEAKNKYPNLKIYNLSFSMGCSITLNYLIEKNDNAFEKLIFFAPAIFLSTYSNLLRLFTPFSFFKFSLPSAIPEGLYAHKSTSVRALKGLQDCVDTISNNSSKIPKNPHVLVFNCPTDRLLNHKKLTAWVTENNLSNWQIIETRPKKGVHFSNHLFLSENHLGKQSYQQMRSIIQEFIGTG